MAPKKVSEKVEARSTLTAVLLADSFTQKFRPISIESPKVLVPLVNVPMIEYTLEWLAANNVEEIFVFCCAHAKAVKEYLDNSKWSKSSRPDVKTVTSTNCLSAGEALRNLEQKDIIKSDFILVSGDTVANMNLAAAMAKHKERRSADKNAIMTMVMKPGCSDTQRRRLGDTDLLVVLDPSTQRLLKYMELDTPESEVLAKVDTSFFSERDTVEVRTDLLDSHISICAPEVLMLFSDNFDYQNIKRDFVTGVLSEEELGNKLYVYELRNEYAVRVHNMRSYDAVSRDILSRWSFPFIPHTNVLNNRQGKKSSYKYNRNHQYLEDGVSISRDATIGRHVCIGSGTQVGDGCRISHSVIGQNCRIGQKAVLQGCYLHDNVVVGDRVELRSCMLCDKAVVKSGAKVKEGAILSYNVVVGANQVVEPYTQVSLCQQVDNHLTLSDDELEYSQQLSTSVDNGSTFSEEAHPVAMEVPSRAALAAAETLSRQDSCPGLASLDFDQSVVGPGGAGYVWKLPGERLDDVMRFSIAKPPERLPAPVTGTIGDEDLGASEQEEEEEEDEEEEGGVMATDRAFMTEVSETFLRCVKMRFPQNNVIIELNALKIAEDRTFADCARYIFTTLLSMCLCAAPKTREEYRHLFPASPPDVGTKEGKAQLLKTFKEHLQDWRSLLRGFLRNEDDQVELLLTFEEYCSEEGVFANCGHPCRMVRAVFLPVLKELYDDELLSEEAILAWASEKEHADESDKQYLKMAEPFIEWLKTAEEEEEEEESEDED